MSTEISSSASFKEPSSLVTDARGILRHEGRSLLQLADRLGGEFDRAARAILAARGMLLVTGIGKAGLVGRKISATMSSLGTPSHFLHPTEAFHGDLGCVSSADVVLALSASGQTDEVVRLAGLIKERGNHLIAVTSQATSALGRLADIVLELGETQEAGKLRLAPTTSTTMMLGLGDALALVVSEQRQFLAENFANNHPGGSLGRRLLRVEDVMRPLSECRLANERASVREVFVRQRVPGRRSGAVMVTNDAGSLSGIFTDSDLARLLERKRDMALDGPIGDVMTRGPQSISVRSWLSDAVRLLAAQKISELPVTDRQGNPVGLIDITDVVAVAPPGSLDVAEGSAGQPGVDDREPPILPFALRPEGDSRP